jgi:DNA-binding GntR family transcriptional regulator
MVVRHSLREQIRDEILARIGSGVLAPGDRIVEAKLAEELKVSSIPIREALRELVAMGILESAPHRGAWVREVSLQETIDALEVREALDALAIRKAAKRLRAQIGQLREIVTHLVDTAARRDFVTFQQYNQAFHRMILDASGNRALTRSHDALAFEVRTRFVMNVVTADPVAIAREHEAIVDALEGGDTREAIRLEVAHSQRLIEYLQREMDHQPQGERKTAHA